MVCRTGAQRFTDLVESLLEQRLAEFGISAADFAEICAIASSRPGARDVNRSVLDQILAVDDFLSACAARPGVRSDRVRRPRRTEDAEDDEDDEAREGEEEGEGPRRRGSESRWGK